MFDSYYIIGNDSGTPTRGAQTKNCFGIFFGNVFASVELYKIFARRDYPRALRDRENRRAL